MQLQNNYTKTLSNVIGLSIALAVNVFLFAISLVVFFLNRACCAPCASRGTCGVQKNRKQIHMLLHLIVVFLGARVVMVLLRLLHYALYPPEQWNPVDAAGNVMFAITEAMYITVFSCIVLFWLWLVQLMNKDGKVPRAIFIIARVCVVLVNVITVAACFLVGAAFGIPKEIMQDWADIIPSYVGGPVLAIGIIVLNSLTLILLIIIVVRLKGSLQLRYTEELQSTSAEADVISKQNTLATRMMIIMLVCVITLSSHLIGIVLLALSVYAWIITLFLQTIPDFLSMTAVLYLFVPLKASTQKAKSAAEAPTSHELDTLRTTNSATPKTPRDLTSESTAVAITPVESEKNS